MTIREKMQLIASGYAGLAKGNNGELVRIVDIRLEAYDVKLPTTKKEYGRVQTAGQV